MTQVSPLLVIRTQERGEPRHSGRVVKQPDRFISLGEILVELETDPKNYNEVGQDKDVTF